MNRVDLMIKSMICLPSAKAYNATYLSFSLVVMLHLLIFFPCFLSLFNLLFPSLEPYQIFSLVLIGLGGGPYTCCHCLESLQVFAYLTQILIAEILFIQKFPQAFRLYTQLVIDCFLQMSILIQFYFYQPVCPFFIHCSR